MQKRSERTLINRYYTAKVNQGSEFPGMDSAGCPEIDLFRKIWNAKKRQMQLPVL
jgi:hypothetical protein